MNIVNNSKTVLDGGWSCGAMVLGKTSSAGASNKLDDSSARAYCACSRCGWGCLNIFLSFIFFFLLSPSF